MKLKYKIKILALRIKILSTNLVNQKLAAAKAFEIFCTPFLSKAYPINLFTTQPVIEDIAFENNFIKTYRFNINAPKQLLIAHGFNSAAYKFDHIIQKFIKAGYSITAFDAPAHGNSGGNMLQTEIYKNAIQAIENKLGSFDLYLGHSMGGLALCIYQSEVKKLTSNQLILIAPASNTQQIITDFAKRLKLSRQILKNIFDYIQNFSGKDIDSFHIKNNLPNDDCSILWIHDYNDKITPITDILAIQKQNPKNIEFYLTKHLGHNKIYRDEKVMQKILNFTKS
ncbi:MAG: alpha/beta hydrolase [Chitinophagaceae bacterium]|nr:MAG: alpha/beta hydrolase [Chitinophagaceae bacterium]